MPFFRTSRDAPPPPLGRWLNRRRKAAWLKGGLIAAALAGLLIYRGLGPAPAPIQWARRPLRVVRVIDAHTLRIRADEAQRRNEENQTVVRLLGVQAEQGKPHRLREAAAGRMVTLSFDEQRWRDEADRLLAYVYLDDGRMLNEWLIERGFACSDPAARHELSDWFAQLERQARSRGRGRWEDSSADQ